MPFWKKDKIIFERGDTVKVKDGVVLTELNIDISDWHGRVMEVDAKSVEFELDSIALRNLEETLIDYYTERREYPHLITMPKTDIEKAEARDEYEDVELAQDELIEKIDLADKRPKFRRLSGKWTRHFIRSEIYKSMEKRYRIDTDPIIELFTNQMYDYERKPPNKWNVKAAKRVFLNWAPNKITAEKEFFESYGEVLLKFFEFLEERKYLKTKALHDLLTQVKDKIVEKSQDSSNWGMAKSFMMGAQREGVDLSNKREIDKYMMKQQLKALMQIRKKK